MMKKKDATSLLTRWFGIFAAICVTFTILAAALSTIYCMRTEFRYDYNTLVEYRKLLEKGLESGAEDPFGDLDIYGIAANVEEEWGGFVYAVLDAGTGKIIAPKDLDPKYADFRYEDPKAAIETFGCKCWTSNAEGKKFFSMSSRFENYPLRLIYTSSYAYAFEMPLWTMIIFFMSIILLIGIVFAAAKLFLLPPVIKAANAKHAAELELSHAAQMQRLATTTHFPESPFCDHYGMLKPAKEVGGDLLGCILKDDKLRFVIGDVSDKGTQAAFVMFLLSNILYPMFKNGESPEQEMKAVNGTICDNDLYDMFCTLIVGEIDFKTRQMHFVNAGHCRMLINGKLYDAQTNIPAGIIRDYDFKADTITLEEGSTVVLYTDGVTEERRASDGVLFGEERLLEWWKGVSEDWCAEKICTSLDAAVEEWQCSKGQSDDRAVMTIKVK